MPPRYYFNLTNSEDLIRDDDGIEIHDLHAALLYAAQAVEELRMDDPSASAEWQGWRLEIVDSVGRAVGSLVLDDPPPEPAFRH